MFFKQNYNNNSFFNHRRKLMVSILGFLPLFWILPRRGFTIARKITFDVGEPASIDNVDKKLSSFMNCEIYYKSKKKFINQGYLIQTHFSLDGSNVKIVYIFPTKQILLEWQKILKSNQVFTENLPANFFSIRDYHIPDTIGLLS